MNMIRSYSHDNTGNKTLFLRFQMSFIRRTVRVYRLLIVPILSFGPDCSFEDDQDGVLRWRVLWRDLIPIHERRKEGKCRPNVH